MARSILWAALAVLCYVGPGWSQDAPHAIKDLEYARHDGVSLLGDLYQPPDDAAHPAVILIHGGSFRAGSKADYGRTWGPYLAARGYVVFAIDYRLSTPQRITWPQALLDAKAAVQYVRGHAAVLGVNPDRIAIGGDSAGATLASLVALTPDWPAFARAYPGDAYAMTSTTVQAVVAIYGAYDLPAWQRYTLGTTNKGSLEQFLGGAPDQVPGRYFEASALSYVRASATRLGPLATPNAGVRVPWFVSWGLKDDVVPPEAQSVALVQSLREAGATVTAVSVPNTGHLFFRVAPLTGKKGRPVCQDTTLAKYACSGASPNDYIQPSFLAFLGRALGR